MGDDCPQMYVNRKPARPARSGRLMWTLGSYVPIIESIPYVFWGGRGTACLQFDGTSPSVDHVGAGSEIVEQHVPSTNTQRTLFYSGLCLPQKWQDVKMSQLLVVDYR